MEPIKEENVPEPDEEATLMMDDNNSVDTANRSKFSAIDSR